MLETMEFTVEQLNYFRVCNIALSIVPEGLRTIFKQEWDALYTATPHGQWIDTPINYTSFYAMESKRNRSRNNRLLGNMISGDRREWDCTCLFYAIMYSDSVGPTLSPIVKTNVDVLREIRNEVAHNNDASLTDAEFQASIQKITTAFNTLTLDTIRVNEMKLQTSFPTKELDNIKQELKNIKKDLEDEKKRNAKPSCFCVLPPKPSHDTIDRMEEVGRIYEEMNRLSSEKKGETTMVYLSGNPGCGKSVLARQIGDKYFDDTTADLKFITTINASNMDTLFQSYVGFAGKLNCHPDCITNIATSKDLSKEDQIIQLKALADKQVAKYSSWLMIVDNVIDLKSFSKYWPQSGEKMRGKGQILVTTQDSPSIALSSHCRHVSLSPGMTHDDAMELLSRVSGLRDEDEMMLKAAKVLDFQPLALSCAGVSVHSALTTNKLFTWPQYLEKLEKGKREITEKVYQRTSLIYTTTMTAAVHLSVEREIVEEKIMLHAFEFLSAIAPEPIPLHYVVQYVMKCMTDQDEDEVASRICSSSLVLSSFEDAKVISVHQVVYHCLRNNQGRLKEVDMFVVISAFSQLTRFDMETADHFIVTRQLVNHMTTIAERLESYLEQLQSASFLINDDSFLLSLRSVGKICEDHATYEPAKTVSQLCLAIELSVRDMENIQKVPIFKVKDILYAVKHSDYDKYIGNIPHHETNGSAAAALNNLGGIFYKLGQYDEAKTHFEKALVIDETAYGESHPSIATTLNNLGLIFYELGQYAEAKTHYEKALVIYKTAYGENHPLIAPPLNNLGLTFYELGQYDEAKTHYEKALVIDKTAYGENHPSIATILNNLGLTFNKLGQYDEAETHYEKALVICKTAYGENHPSIATTLNNLGQTCYELGQYDEAKTHYEKALAIYKTAYGENHPSIATTLNNLGETFYKLGQYDEAKTHYEKALVIKKIAFGENHPSIATTLDNLGLTFYELGQYDEAKTHFEKALVVSKTTYGENHPSIATKLNNLGQTFYKLGQYDEAKTHYEKALVIYKTAYGETHPSIATTLNNLGETFYKLGQYEEAKTHYEKALVIKKTAYGENHPSIATTLDNLGRTFYELGQYDEAKTHFEKALVISKTTYGENHPSIATTLNKLGQTFYKLGQYDEAKTHYEKALVIYKTAYGEKIIHR
ncbi:hypothetical protein QZH41_018638 [Actinostola sp. cb2023]|nr:hypothetical protein QZH41_018638 [Actinostola sp. cb2023]